MSEKVTDVQLLEIEAARLMRELSDTYKSWAECNKVYLQPVITEKELRTTQHQIGLCVNRAQDLLLRYEQNQREYNQVLNDVCSLGIENLPN